MPSLGALLQEYCNANLITWCRTHHVAGGSKLLALFLLVSESLVYLFLAFDSTCAEVQCC